MGGVCSSKTANRQGRRKPQNEERPTQRSAVDVNNTKRDQHSSRADQDRSQTSLKGLSNTAKQVFILCKELLRSTRNQAETTSAFHEVCDKIRQLQPRAFPDETSPPDREEAMDRFLAWCKEKRVRMDGVVPKEYPGTGWGIQAKIDLKCPQEACCVPYAAMISSVDSIKEFGSVISRSGTDPAWIQAPLGMRLYEERLKGEESSFKPYLDVLPQKFPHPNFFDAMAFQYLQPSPLYNDAKGICYEMSSQFARMYMEMCRQRVKGSWSNHYRMNPDNFTLDGYIWAATIALTRTLKVQDTKENYVTVMVPLWDLCNHGEEMLGTEIQLHADPKSATGYDMRMSQLVASATREISQGEEITLVYREDSSPADFLTVWGIPLVDYVSSVSVDPPSTGKKQKKPIKVKIYNRDFPINEEDYQALGKEFETGKGTPAAPSSIWTAVAAGAQAKLNQYPYQLDEYKKLRDSTPNENAQLSLSVVINEISVLQKAIGSLQDLLANDREVKEAVSAGSASSSQLSEDRKVDVPAS